MLKLTGGMKTVPVSTDEQTGQYHAYSVLPFHTGIPGCVFAKSSGDEVKVGPHCHGLDSGIVPASGDCATLIHSLDGLFGHVQLHDTGAVKGPRISRAKVCFLGKYAMCDYHTYRMASLERSFRLL